MELISTTEDEDLDHSVMEALRVHAWRTEQLRRLGLSHTLADRFADLVDWHTLAGLIERGCPAELALEIVRQPSPIGASLEAPERGRSLMVKITDKTDYSRFVRPSDADEGIWLDYVEVHLVTHPVGQVKEMHVHDPPQDHVITIRSGRMRWTVDGATLDAGPGDVIVTPAGTPHSYEVLGDEPARVVCVDSPVRAKPG